MCGSVSNVLSVFASVTCDKAFYLCLEFTVFSEGFLFLLPLLSPSFVWICRWLDVVVPDVVIVVVVFVGC